MTRQASPVDGGPAFERICRLSQDATNELWSVTLRREYKTPGEKKRAIERVIRGAIETATGSPSTTSGWSEDDIDGYVPIFGPGNPPRSKENPFARRATLTGETEA